MNAEKGELHGQNLEEKIIPLIPAHENFLIKA